jgi:hypothetical protein
LFLLSRIKSYAAVPEGPLAPPQFIEQLSHCAKTIARKLLNWRRLSRQAGLIRFTFTQTWGSGLHDRTATNRKARPMAATVVSELKGINAMTTLKIAEEEILTFDVSDEALEIAGMVTGTTNFTFGGLHF